MSRSYQAEDEIASRAYDGHPMRANLSTLIAAVACASFSCAPEELAFLAAGPNETIVLIEVSDNEIVATAIAAERRPVIERIEQGRINTIFVLSYDMKPGGIPLGPLHVDPHGDPLPTPARVHRMQVRGVDAPKWEAIDSVPLELGVLRFREATRCEVFATESRVMSNPRELAARFVVPLGADRVLLGTDPQGLFVVNPRGEVELPLSETTAPSLAGYRAPDGEIWLAGRGGVIAHGDPEHGFARAPDMSADVAMLDGTKDDSPFEIFALTSSLAVHRYSEGHWSMVQDAAQTVASRGRPAIAWAKERSAVLIGTANKSLTELEVDSAAREIQLDLPVQVTEDALLSARWVRGMGVVAGTRYSIFYARRGDHWEQLATPVDTPRASVIIDLGDGSFLGGGQSGELYHWIDGYGLCESIFVPAGSDIWAAAPIENGWILVSGGGSESFLITTLRRM